MKGEDLQVWEIHPASLEEMFPLGFQPINRSTSIELHAKSINFNVEIDGSVHNSRLVDLECVGAFVDGHGRIDAWVEVERVAPDVDGDEVAGYKAKGGDSRTEIHGERGKRERSERLMNS